VPHRSRACHLGRYPSIVLGDLVFFPSWDRLVPFLAASLALNLTPGADMTYVLSRSVAQGRAAGIASSFGILTGAVGHTVLAAVGVSALLAASAIGFEVLRWAGAVYLAWLAFKLWRADASASAADSAAPVGLWRVWGEGVLVNLLNPKVAIFILAFLPQFTDPTRGPVWMQIAALGTLFNLGGTAVNCAVALVAGSFAQKLRARPRIRVWMNRVSGTVLGLLAVRLAFSQRR
jgi:threonine/homoserine/homoserine lactone efflux protein